MKKILKIAEGILDIIGNILVIAAGILVAFIVLSAGGCRSTTNVEVILACERIENQVVCGVVEATPAIPQDVEIVVETRSSDDASS